MTVNGSSGPDMEPAGTGDRNEEIERAQCLLDALRGRSVFIETYGCRLKSCGITVARLWRIPMMQRLSSSIPARS
jgi:hypothetical protein